MIKKDLEIYNKEIVQVPNCVLYPHQKNAWTGFNKVLKEYPKGLKLIILEWHRRAGTPFGG